MCAQCVKTCHVKKCTLSTCARYIACGALCSYAAPRARGARLLWGPFLSHSWVFFSIIELHLWFSAVNQKNLPCSSNSKVGACALAYLGLASRLLSRVVHAKQKKMACVFPARLDNQKRLVHFICIACCLRAAATAGKVLLIQDKNWIKHIGRLCHFCIFWFLSVTWIVS